jgi:predicted metal-dependent phosphoesterase TrpH
MIDLHMHTTASDGRSTPEVLLDQVRAVGIDTFAIADHDTMASVAETADLAARAGLRFIAGVEITAVHRRKDVHVLGYFCDPASPTLRSFLADSCADRLRRAREMGEKLAELGVAVDIDALIASSGGLNSGRSVARPSVAQALVKAGYVKDVQEAFDKYLADDRPAYVPRVGASPMAVIEIIRRSGGIASFAHPGPLGMDDLISDMVDAGLTAIECYHSEHSPEVTDKYLHLAERYGLAVSGGSDFHGEGMRRAECFGKVGLPPECFAALAARARRA